MTTNTHKIQLMSGETILITENQADAIKEAVRNGAEWIPVGEELINPKSIAKIGFHHATPVERKMTENNIEMKLAEAGRFDLIEMKRKLVKDKTIQHSIDKDRNFIDKVKAGDPKALKAWYNLPDKEKTQISGTDQSGDYYLSEAGEKMYS